MKAIYSGVAACAVLVSGSVFAQTASNTMTNIATVVGGCDIVAIGVNFGVVASPMAADHTSFNANTATPNAAAANQDHAGLDADGGAGNDDELSITTPISAVNGVLSTAISTVIGANPAPGVYVACTSPVNTLELEKADGSTVALPTAATATPTDFSSTMTHTDGTSTLNYTMSFATVVVDTSLSPVPLYVASYISATNTVPSQADLTEGDYTEEVIATIDF